MTAREKLRLTPEDCAALRKEWSSLTEEEKEVRGCVMIKLVSHLKTNLRDSENDPTYRRREKMRLRIALRTIAGWESNLKE